MPILYIYIIIGVVLLWFLLAFLFKPIGKFFLKLWEDVINEIKEEENEDE